MDDRAEVKVVVAREETAGETAGAAGGPAEDPDDRKRPERIPAGPGRAEVAMELDLMFLKKTPPHSLEAERTVLGGILVQNESLNVVLSTISPEDFYKDAHRKIIERIVALVDKGLAGRPPDPDRGRPAGRHPRGDRRGLLSLVPPRRRAPEPQRRILRPDHQGEGPPPPADPVVDADHPGELRAEGGRRRAAQRRPGGHRRGRRAAHQARLPGHEQPDRADPGDDPRPGRAQGGRHRASPPGSATSTA